MRLVRVAVNAEQLLYPSPGGVGRYTAQLLTVLPHIHPGDDVVAFTARHRRSTVQAVLRRAGAADRVADGCVVLPLPRPALYEGWVRWGSPRLPGLHDAELVHAPSVAVPPHPRVPLVVTVHDAAPELFPEAFPARGRRFHRLGMAAAAQRADLVLTVSRAAADEITARSAIPADRIRVVHHGIDPPHIEPGRRRRLLAARGLDDRPFVLWIGSREPRKGVGTVVAAMARLRRRPGLAATTPLVLAGYPGWLEDGIDDADRAVLGADLVQLGQVPEEELWSLYGGATLLAFPSRHEGFGLPVLEAMSQGTAVVASDIAPLREVAGGVARLVPPGNLDGWADAIDELLADDAQRRRMGDAGRRHAEHFGAAEWATRIRAVYAELVGREAPSR
jgi:glycosyltransferase involved in cell wall biosynthesis